MSTTTIKSRGTVTIDVETCKGCELCIPACPPRVLTMSTDGEPLGYRYPSCTPAAPGCAACLLRLPRLRASRCSGSTSRSTSREVGTRRRMTATGATAERG